MKGFFRNIFGFCGAIVILVLALGTFCADQFVTKGAHHTYAIARVSHVEASEAMCHRAETPTVAISHRTSESTSEISLRQPLGKFLPFSFTIPPEIGPNLGRSHLVSWFGFAKHREIQDVILRS